MLQYKRRNAKQEAKQHFCQYTLADLTRCINTIRKNTCCHLLFKNLCLVYFFRWLPEIILLYFLNKMILYSRCRCVQNWHRNSKAKQLLLSRLFLSKTESNIKPTKNTLCKSIISDLTGLSFCDFPWFCCFLKKLKFIRHIHFTDLPTPSVITHYHCTYNI